MADAQTVNVPFGVDGKPTGQLPVDPNAPVTQPKAGPSKPAWLPEKFWDASSGQPKVEALAGSYAELEKRFSSEPKAPEVKATPASKPNLELPKKAETPTPEVKSTEQQAQQATRLSDADLFEFSKEYDQNGQLSPETYTKLESMGHSKGLVDSVIAGQLALRQVTRAETTALVGGDDAYTEMASWAAEALSPEERSAFDRAVLGTDSGARKAAVLGLHARYQASAGNPPAATVRGTAGNGGTGNAFRSQGEMIAAMKDPRYKTDSAYQQDVIARVAGMR